MKIKAIIITYKELHSLAPVPCLPHFLSLEPLIHSALASVFLKCPKQSLPQGFVLLFSVLQPLFPQLIIWLTASLSSNTHSEVTSVMPSLTTLLKVMCHPSIPTLFYFSPKYMS